MVPQTSRKASELYSAQIGCCLSTSDGKKYTAALVFTKYAHVAEKLSVPGRQAPDNTVPRLTERHFLRKVAPKTEKSKPQRRCGVCSKHGKKKTSVYCCQICDVRLCLEDCCELYHTRLSY